MRSITSLLLAGLLAVTLSVYGCGSDDDDGDGKGGASNVAGNTGEGGDGGDTGEGGEGGDTGEGGEGGDTGEGGEGGDTGEDPCNDVEAGNAIPEVYETHPGAHGGDIADGVYVLGKAVMFDDEETGVTGRQIAGGLRIDDTTFEIVVVIDGEETRYNATMEVENPSLTLTRTCGGDDELTHSFTVVNATGDFILFAEDDSTALHFQPVVN